jgi:hypothetical protein
MNGYFGKDFFKIKELNVAKRSEHQTLARETQSKHKSPVQGSSLVYMR